MGNGSPPFHVFPFLANQFPRDLFLFARLSTWAAAAFILSFILFILFLTRTHLTREDKNARFFTRAFFIALIIIFPGMHYFGILPITDVSDFIRKPGVVKIFPTERGLDAKNTIREDSITAVLPDPEERGALLASTGNTIIKIDIRGRCSKIARLSHNADILSYDQWRRSIFAVDSQKSLLSIIPAYGTGHERALSIRTDWSGQVRAVLPFDNIFYIMYDGRPGISEFGTDSGSQNSGIQFLQPRAISFRTGGWGLGAHRPSRALFALAGALGTSRKCAILQIDPARFTTVRMGVLPDSGAAFLLHPSLPLAYMGSFDRNVIYEINLSSFKVRRALPGPASCRSLALDIRRNILFSSGYFSGKLVAVDLSSGEILRKNTTGARIMDIEIDSFGQYLYTATTKGVFRTDISSYTGIVPEASVAPER